MAQILQVKQATRPKRSY